MDGNELLLILVVFSCVAFLVAALRMPFRLIRPQFFATAGTLAITGAGYFLFPDIAGYVGGALWGAFFLVPNFGARWVQRLSTQRRYTLARTVARVLQWVQPWGTWRPLAEIFRALELARRGQADKAVAVLERQHGFAGPMAASARAEIARITGRWAELVEWVRTLPPGELQRHLELISPYLRALGETDQTPTLLATYMQYEGLLSRPVYVTHLRMSRLMVLVFCGRVRGVERFCDVFLGNAPASSRQIWIARARLAAGDEGGREAVKALAADSSVEPDARAAAARLIDRKPSPPFVPDATAAALLDRIETELDQAVRYGIVVAASAAKPVLTWLLIAANVAMFAVEELRGADEDVLNQLGALTPRAIETGEWWRFVAAMFLHGGIWHIGMNMLALVVLGPYLERAIGRIRFSTVYFAAGVISMYAECLVALRNHIPDEPIVGASGAIMALVGGTAAVMLDGWRRERAMLAKRRLFVMVFIIATQALFDTVFNRLSSGVQVAGMAHFVGAIAGFVVAALLLLVQRRPARGRLQTA